MRKKEKNKRRKEASFETLFVFEMNRHGARSANTMKAETPVPDDYYGSPEMKGGILTDIGRE